MYVNIISQHGRVRTNKNNIDKYESICKSCADEHPNYFYRSQSISQVR